MNSQVIMQALPVRNRTMVVVENQTVKDIIRLISWAHERTADQYDKISPMFDRGTTRKTAHGLWDFCKDNVLYFIETEKKQTVRSPGRILANQVGDCKHYASFIAGVLDSLKRKGRPIDWCYRFSRYQNLLGSTNHVFVVIRTRSGEIWIDPVLDEFDERLPYKSCMDKTVNTMRRSILGCMNDFTCGCGNKKVGAVASSYYKASNGAVFAVNDQVRSNGLTPDQMGLPYAMEVLARGFDQKHPGAADTWWVNPPVTFWLNGQPYPLPPPNTKVGGAVPLLPPGLTVAYAPSFMGYTIPENFPKPCVAPGAPQNKLQICPTDMPGFPGTQTNGQLSANDSILLIILEAALGPLINSFSSYPYASNFSSTNNLDDKCFNHRNADDLLQPSISRTVLHTVASDALAVVAPVASIIAPFASTYINQAKAAVNKPIAPAITTVNYAYPSTATAQTGTPQQGTAAPISLPSGGPGIGTILLAGGALLLLALSSSKHKRN